ncbi:MAG: hypothetical protein RL662_105 [Bacteroidota bacterium]|jgi:tetratricopeptide (TPR) repeat protein
MKKQILLLLFLILHLYGYSQERNSASSSVVDTLKYLTTNYQFQKALEYIERQKPTRSLLIEKILCYKALGENNKAGEVLLSLAQQYPKDIYILNELALSFQATGKWKAGEQCYDQLIEIDSTNIYYKIKKGNLLYNQTRYNEAIDVYKEIYINNGTPSILKQLGRSYESINMNDSARVYYSKAWEYDPSDSQTAILYGNFSIRRKDVSTALEVCETFLAQDSTNSQINFLHAFAYYIKDDYEAAAALFEKCIAGGDSTLLVNRSLGLSYFSLKDSRAYRSLNKAYAEDTTNISVLYSLATVCNDLEKSEEAIKYYSTLVDRIISEQAHLYLYYRGLAIAYTNEEEYKKAISNYKEAINYGSENQQSLMRHTIANLYDYKLKDNDNALKYYKLYKIDLQKFIEKLKESEDINLNDVKDAERRLKALDQYIEYMEDKKQVTLLNNIRHP